MSNNNSANITLSLLLVLFVGLKLGHVIDWSWWWVTSPIWLPLAVLVVAVVIYLIIKKIIE